MNINQLIFDCLTSTFSESASDQTVIEHCKNHYNIDDVELILMLWNEVKEMKLDLKKE